MALAGCEKGPVGCWRGEGGAQLDFFRDFLRYLRSRKRYWLLPIIIVLGLFAGLVVLTEGSTIAPFIYALF
ncbi:MAG TPA: DUF5989 family protein [Stellaceae bacterium]|nr:DUF5989 family protein [Stellaceae bacterium]